MCRLGKSTRSKYGCEFEESMNSLADISLTYSGSFVAHLVICLSCMMTFDVDFSGRTRALAFCRNRKSAVISTTWPTAHSCVDDVRTWLISSGAELLFDASVYMKPEAAVPAILALYHGERTPRFCPLQFFLFSFSF